MEPVCGDADEVTDADPVATRNLTAALADCFAKSAEKNNKRFKYKGKEYSLKETNTHGSVKF
jgi:hypothetical protein